MTANVVTKLQLDGNAVSSPFLERHPLNQEFKWVDHVGPRRILTAAQVDEYDRQGFLVLESALSGEVVESIVAALEPIVAKGERFHDAVFATRPTTESSVLKECCRTAIFRDLCHDLIGDSVRLYWDQAVYKSPGRTSFAWHQDNGYQYIEPQHYLTCWIALSDASAASGCPWVYPGVHRAGTLRHRSSDFGMTCVEPSRSCVDMLPGASIVPVRAGGMVVFSSLTPHATGPNLTSHERKAYILQ